MSVRNAGRGIAKRLLVPALGAALSLACAPAEFEPKSKVEGLRLLGLQSSANIVEPGQPITLEALWVDSRPDAGGRTITAWFPGCLNPELTSLSECQDELNALRPAAGQEWPAEFSPTFGTRFDTTVSPDILQGRKDFGIQAFFFAACRGSRLEFTPSPHDTVPITCRDADGDYVGQRDLRLGFRTVTALAGVGSLATPNPVITGFDFDGQVFAPHCVGEACIGFQQPDCTTLSCPRIRASECDEKGNVDEECDGGLFRVLVDESAIGVDWLLGDDDGLQSVEVFARYFASSGEVHRDSDVLHVHEPVGQQNQWDRENQSALLTPGQQFLWAVVYDSVGSVSWAGIGVDAFR